MKTLRMSRSCYDRNARRAIVYRGVGEPDPQEVLSGRRWRRANRHALAKIAENDAMLMGKMMSSSSG